ncbi:alpha-(1,3)-fucosyltransferase C-like [Pieris brassicae]|uniref:alpha-(1,3)-fucosyltransferase C-like n=1 Tax=Pieris brassicae TaxID=7116 RepID=UPI001E66065A|nr:alpha-(1,3)-fucosyltransferase C-like [Pieris brassicae]
MLCYRLFVRKLFALFPLLILFWIFYIIYTYHTKMNFIRANRKDKSHLSHKNMKYVLQWTRRFSAPFDWMGEGNSAFVKYKCKYTNCYVTDDRSYFLDQKDFDAIVFNGRDVIHLWPFQMPSQRSPRQKFIFGAMESPDNFPACDKNLDGFFNWTWTYKLDSDIRWGYIAIYNKNGQLVGPKIDMVWPKMTPVSDGLKSKLKKKTKAVAWFVSHCSTKSGREHYVSRLNNELEAFGLSVDIYGSCGSLTCPRTNEKSCFKMIKDDYHFYLSFENSFSEDYVTEKMLTALNNYAVPIVFGAAVYKRFLPDGSYIDARALGPTALASEINSIIENKTKFYDFFRWRNHLVYKGTDGPDVCNLCEILNDEEKVQQVSVWKDFRVWWNGARYKDNCF